MSRFYEKDPLPRRRTSENFWRFRPLLVAEWPFGVKQALSIFMVRCALEEHEGSHLRADRL